MEFISRLKIDFEFLEFMLRRYGLKHPCLDCILRPISCNITECSLRNDFWTSCRKVINLSEVWNEFHKEVRYKRKTKGDLNQGILG